MELLMSTCRRCGKPLMTGDSEEVPALVPVKERWERICGDCLEPGEAKQMAHEILAAIHEGRGEEHTCTYEPTGTYEEGEEVMRCPECGDTDRDPTRHPPEGSCPVCGGELRECDELRGGEGTGFLLVVCVRCGHEVSRTWAGF